MYRKKTICFKETVLQSCKISSTEPKIFSDINELNNKVCGQATVLKPCQEIF